MCIVISSCGLLRFGVVALVVEYSPVSGVVALTLMVYIVLGTKLVSSIDVSVYLVVKLIIFSPVFVSYLTS